MLRTQTHTHTHPLWCRSWQSVDLSQSHRPSFVFAPRYVAHGFFCSFPSFDFFSVPSFRYCSPSSSSSLSSSLLLSFSVSSSSSSSFTPLCTYPRSLLLCIISINISTIIATTLSTDNGYHSPTILPSHPCHHPLHIHTHTHIPNLFFLFFLYSSSCYYLLPSFSNGYAPPIVNCKYPFFPLLLLCLLPTLIHTHTHTPCNNIASHRISESLN
ncbi:hypothetical protein K457DRAFT_876235 [Linnemannia elongata AG-77]|uniref:Uncharacterized protein n=1 Tax=Linnemannia elongata AG-77 TaxID=1314771 RepID=A0A197JHE8_9FUNG|nr:hypothetical protein K457DRAFT_876235 [Linnemannia elongata AG-77]